MVRFYRSENCLVIYTAESLPFPSIIYLFIYTTVCKYKDTHRKRDKLQETFMILYVICDPYKSPMLMNGRVRSKMSVGSQSVNFFRAMW